MKILCIGNSFSVDATRYLTEIARADGVTLSVKNLFIGGCSLETHMQNVRDNAANYRIYLDGQETDTYSSIKDALLSDEWDFVTMQQASRYSVDFASYEPHLSELSEYVRTLAPNAKQVIHETWGYESHIERLREVIGVETYGEMFEKVHHAYALAKERINADRLIPSGSVIGMLLSRGVPSLHRDGFHLSYGLGRYAAALAYYTTLTGNSVIGNRFRDFDEPIAESDVILAQECVTAVVKAQKM